MEYDTHALCAQLRTFIARRSGLEAGDYFDPRQPDPEGVKAFSSDRYVIARDGRGARAMLGYIDNRSADRFDLPAAALSAWSGRLSLGADRVEYCTGQNFSVEYRGADRVEYCTGQNFSVEYRGAACTVLARAIRADWRTSHPGSHSADLAGRIGELWRKARR